MVSGRVRGRWSWFAGLGIVMLFLIMMAGPVLGKGINVYQLIDFNPDSRGFFPGGKIEFHDLRGTEEYRVVHRIYTFSCLVDNNDIIMAFQFRFRLYHSEEWFPWYEQEEDQPILCQAGGDSYIQQIFLAPAEADLNRGEFTFEVEDLHLGEPVALNFHELQTLNPALEFYEPMDPPLTEDGSFVLYAPPGPGVGFVTDAQGDIYSLIRILQHEEGEGEYHHPQLGNISMPNIVHLGHVEGKFDLDDWLEAPPEPPQEVIQKEVEDFDHLAPVGPGFIFKEIDFQVVAGNMLAVSGTILNETGNNYTMAIFEITLYDPEGIKLGTGPLQVMGLPDGQEYQGTLGTLPFPVEEEDLGDFSFEIEFSTGY